jgi:hypothetical protein
MDAKWAFCNCSPRGGLEVSQRCKLLNWVIIISLEGVTAAATSAAFMNGML